MYPKGVISMAYFSSQTFLVFTPEFSRTLGNNFVCKMLAVKCLDKLDILLTCP